MSFKLDGVDAATYGIIVEHRPHIITAARDVEPITIPGRVGSILNDRGGYLNYTQSYTVAIADQPLSDAAAARARMAAHWLTLHSDDYYPLEDDGDTSIRMARFVGPADIANEFGRVGRATLYFDVRPQRYFPSGQTAQRFLTVVGGSFNASTGAIQNYSNYRRTGLIPFAKDDDPWDIVNTTALTIGHYDTSGTFKTGLSVAAGAGASIFPSSEDTLIRLSWKTGGTIEISGPGTQAIYNDTGPILTNAQGMDAAPLIRFNGSPIDGVPIFGGVKIGTRRLLIMDFDESESGEVYADCETMASYLLTSGGERISLNRYASVTDSALDAYADGYPIIRVADADDDGNVQLDTTGTNAGLAYETPCWSMDITPRWWSL